MLRQSHLQLSQRNMFRPAAFLNLSLSLSQKFILFSLRSIVIYYVVNVVIKRRNDMPIVRVEMWPGRTRAQKAELAKAITDAIVKIAKTTPEATTIVFEDVAKENWAIGGKLAADS